jgi:hypothetical protein
VGRSCLAEAWFGLPGRARLVVLVAVAVVAVDHLAKFGAAWLEPAGYLQNPEPMVYDWAMLVPLVALLVPVRLTAALLGLFLGGSGSNVADVYLWPGGVPDFIPVGDWLINPADVAIFSGISALMAWPVWKLFQIARRQYPERPSSSAEAGQERSARLHAASVPAVRDPGPPLEPPAEVSQPAPSAPG